MLRIAMLRGITLTSPPTDFGVKTSYESFTKSVSRDMWSTSKAREAPKFIALVGYSTGRIDSPRGYGVQCGVAYITRNFPEVRWPPQTCTYRCEAKCGVARNPPVPRGEGTISPGFVHNVVACCINTRGGLQTHTLSHMGDDVIEGQHASE